MSLKFLKRKIIIISRSFQMRRPELKEQVRRGDIDLGVPQRRDSFKLKTGALGHAPCVRDPTILGKCRDFLRLAS